MLTKKNKKYKAKRIANIFEEEGQAITQSKSKFTQKSIDSLKDSFAGDNIAGSVATLAAGAMDIAGVGISNSQVDTSTADNAISAINSYQPSVSSLESLASSYNKLDLNDSTYNSSDFTVDTKTGLLNMGKAAATGAATGAMVGGPWGAVIGGAAGLLGSGAGWIAGSVKAKNEVERLERESFIAKENAKARALSARDSILENTKNTFMSNIVSKGGKLNTLNKNLFDVGGLMHQHGGIFSNGITFVDNGGTHEENPLEGIQFGVDNQGIPNLVEEGEVIWNDYVFSNRLKPTEEFKKRFKVKGESFADVAKFMQKESAERPNDPISKNGLKDSMYKLINEHEMVKSKKDRKREAKNIFDTGSWLRYAPAVGSALGVLSDVVGLTNKPDYTNVDAIQKTTDSFVPIEHTPINTKLSYRPFDTEFYSNKLAGQTAATKRAIQNSGATAGGTMAGLLAADFNAQTKLGDLYRQAEEYNQAQKEKVAGFNRQTEAMNAEMLMKAALANQKYDELKLKSAITQAQLKDSIDAAASAGKSANWSNLFTNLGNIGTDILNREDARFRIETMGSALPIDEYARVFGKKGALEEAKRRGFTDEEIAALGFKACGGRIKKRRGGLTY